MRGSYSESDAIAALHLVSFTQLAGGTKDWQPAFSVVSEWLAQTGLSASEDPVVMLRAMSPTAQLIVKATLVSCNKNSARRRPDSFTVVRHFLMCNSNTTF